MSIAKYQPPALSGDYQLTFKGQIAPSTGAVTLIAARTATAGQIFAARWAPGASDARRCFVKYVGARFITTTAFTTPQQMGCDLIVARTFAADAAGGTAIDVGATLTKSGALLTSSTTSGFASADRVRVASTAEITAAAGRVLDASPLSVMVGWSYGLGDTVPANADDDYGTLYDASAPNTDHIVLANDEGIVIRNLLLMGAVGVGRWDLKFIWEEGIPSAG